MENQNQPPRLPRNPVTHAEHRREVLLQITLPLLLGVLLVLAAMATIIFSAVQAPADVSRWADVSLVWLILPSLVIALIILVLLAGIIYAISYMLRLVPGYAYIIQVFFERVKSKASQLTNLSVEPILKINTILAGLRYATGGKKSAAPEQSSADLNPGSL